MAHSGNCKGRREEGSSGVLPHLLWWLTVLLFSTTSTPLCSLLSFSSVIFFFFLSGHPPPLPLHSPRTYLGLGSSPALPLCRQSRARCLLFHTRFLRRDRICMVSLLRCNRPDANVTAIWNDPGDPWLEVGSSRRGCVKLPVFLFFIFFYLCAKYFWASSVSLKVCCHLSKTILLQLPNNFTLNTCRST